jgi:hypothetical protein
VKSRTTYQLAERPPDPPPQSGAGHALAAQLYREKLKASEKRSEQLEEALREMVRFWGSSGSESFHAMRRADALLKEYP